GGRFVSSCFSPDGSRVVTAGEGGARLWHLAGGQEVRSFRPLDLGDHELHGPSFSPDGCRLLACGVDSQPARLWDVETGQEICSLWHPLRGVGRAFFTPDGRRVLTVNTEETLVWDAATGRKVFPGVKWPGSNATVSPDSHRVVTFGGADNPAFGG